MNQAGQYILAIIVLVFFSGLFSAIETAYSVANKIRLKNMYSDGEEKAGEVLKVLEKNGKLETEEVQMAQLYQQQLSQS